MSKSTARLRTGIVLAAAMCTIVSARPIVEDFSRMPVAGCYQDGTLIGASQFVYNGYGCNAFVSLNSNTMLFQRPMTATKPDETHSALVVGPTITGDFTLQVSAATTSQLRTNGPPNPWEVAWLLWHYRDGSHFYYFIAKPNGWELGKEDPAYPGGQRFLASGASPSFPIGRWYSIRVDQAAATIRVFVNGLLIVTMRDQDGPYSSGRVGLYSEDAEVYFDDVVINTSGSKGRK